MKKHITCIVSGRVQGVLYRVFTKDTARHLGLNGEVENQKDGTVRVEAEGEEDKLNQLKLSLEKGSIFSKVERVVCDTGDSLVGYESFNIKRKSFFN